MMDPFSGNSGAKTLVDQYKIDPIGMGIALRNNTKHVAYMLLQTWNLDH
jgi:hypothetical protein